MMSRVSRMSQGCLFVAKVTGEGHREQRGAQWRNWVCMEAVRRVHQNPILYALMKSIFNRISFSLLLFKGRLDEGDSPWL